MLQTLAVRFVLASAPARERQKAFAASVLRGQPNAAVRGTMAAAALDDLAVLGLVQEAVQWTDAQRQRLPYGQGSRNNAAYALFLAGRTAEALVLAQPSVWATSGDRSHAALDTLAATLSASGDPEQAVAVQLRALGAALVRPSTGGAKTREPEMALPLARLAGFYLANGAYEQARMLAATALQADDNLSAMQAARRVWKQACRAMATPGR
jgi:tetratricopeptide (TPR) repeat protein